MTTQRAFREVGGGCWRSAWTVWCRRVCGFSAVCLALVCVCALSFFLTDRYRTARKCARIPVLRVYVYQLAESVVLVSEWSGLWARAAAEEAHSLSYGSGEVDGLGGASGQGQPCSDVRLSEWELRRRVRESRQRFILHRLELELNLAAHGRGRPLGVWRLQDLCGSSALVVDRVWVIGALCVGNLPGAIIVARYVGRRRRRGWGKCGACGYDLRGLPSPRCPECGTPFDRPSASAPASGGAATRRD